MKVKEWMLGLPRNLEFEFRLTCLDENHDVIFDKRCDSYTDILVEYGEYRFSECYLANISFGNGGQKYSLEVVVYKV